MWGCSAGQLCANAWQIVSAENHRVWILENGVSSASPSFAKISRCSKSVAPSHLCSCITVEIACAGSCENPSCCHFSVAIRSKSTGPRSIQILSRTHFRCKIKSEDHQATKMACTTASKSGDRPMIMWRPRMRPDSSSAGLALSAQAC